MSETSAQVVGKHQDEIRKTKLKLSLIEEGTEDKCKPIVTNKYLESELWPCSKIKEVGSQSVC